MSLSVDTYVMRLAFPVVTLIAILYHRIIYDLFLDWWLVPSLSQGLLIPPLTVWIAWSMRARVWSIPAGQDGRGLLLVLASCATLIFGQLAAEFFLSRLSFVMLLAGIAWTFWGLGRLRALIFPFLLLATMVPLPALLYNSVAAPLQLLATTVAAHVAETAGVTVHVDGNIIQLANMSLGVEEACSGLNSLSALIVGGLLLAFVQCSTILSRVLLLVLTIPIAICANILRVAGTAILADVNPMYALGFYHTFSGWLVFVLGFMMLYAAAWGLQMSSEVRR
jgi:exosortase